MIAVHVKQSEERWPGVRAFVSDSDLIAALRRGDEAAFALLIDRYQTALLRVALLYVPSYAVAEEVVQETWLGVFQGIDRFEGRATLKTWIFRILTNRAKTRSAREESCVPFSALDANVDPYESAVDPARFNPPKHADAGGWAASPHSWNQIPEHRLLARETFAHIHAAVAALPASQRMVISLRDIEGWTVEEVCQALNITENNQRVLLHRARARVRNALEQYFARA